MNWTVLQLALWLIAGLVSMYFSFGNARIWTNIAVGFALVLLGELLVFLSGTGLPRIEAMGFVLGAIAVLVLNHGFHEYYLFSRTLEIEGSKLTVYLATLGIVALTLVFLLINPRPVNDLASGRQSLRSIEIVSLTCWACLSLININLIRKIHGNLKDSPVGRGFQAFMVIFLCLLLWKGSELYILVYHLDQLAHLYPLRYKLSLAVSHAANLLASLSVCGTFLYLIRLLR